MAAFILQDCVVLGGGYDLSGSSNEIALSAEVEEKEVTSFASSGYREKIGGLKQATGTIKGYWEAGTAKPDTLLFNNLGVSDTIFSFAPDGTDGSSMYSMRTLQGDYSFGEAIGEVLPFEANLFSRNTQGLVRSTIIHPKSTARTSTGTGTGRQLTTVSSSQTLVAVLHVVTVSGTTPSLTVTLQRDDNSGFTSPTTAATFTAATAVTSEWTTVAGPITPDDRYRVTWTISGTSPSFNFCVGVGIV